MYNHIFTGVSFGFLRLACSF